MEKIPTWTCVVALALHDGEGRWLMHRRPLHKHHGGLWEFPGGKVESGEKPRDALVREAQEELGLTLKSSSLSEAGFAEETQTQGRAPIVILLYTCPWNGDPVAALEGGEVGWFTPQEVAALEKPPLDIALSRGLFEKT
ncbi:NUDIX domain-containing protein [Qipengyuania flava]|nr:NUDIX domain-containing protein [Qipengyuania flava]